MSEAVVSAAIVSAAIVSAAIVCGAIVCGAIVTRGPTSENAPSASTVDPTRCPLASLSLSSCGGMPSSGGRAAARLAVQKVSRAWGRLGVGG